MGSEEIETVAPGFAGGVGMGVVGIVLERSGEGVGVLGTLVRHGA